LLKKFDPMIRVKNLSKQFTVPHERRFGFKDHFINLFSRVSYEKFDALRDINFTVSNAERLGVIGKNGSGKSTLLKILAGIYTANSGEVNIEGNIAPLLELGVGFEPELSASDNIYLNGLLLGISRRYIEEKFNEIVNFAEVENFVDQKLKNFSSGMKMRLAFSIAMHATADVFLIDEIFAVGDYSFQQKSLAIFKNKLKNKTVVFVSHDLDQLKQHCHKILWLDKGYIKEIGQPEEVINRYMKSDG